MDPTVGHTSTEIMHSWSHGVWLEQLRCLFWARHTVRQPSLLMQSAELYVRTVLYALYFIVARTEDD